MKKTAMTAALDKAGVNTGAAALYALATRTLAKHRTAVASLDAFIEKITHGAPLLVALMPRESIRNEALRYLQNVAADMEGKPEKTTDVMKPIRELSSPADDDRGGHSRGDAQRRVVSPASSQEVGGGRSGIDVHTSYAPAGSQDGSGHTTRDARVSGAAPVREPTKAQRETAARVANQIARSISQTFKVASLDGQLLPNVDPSSYERMIFVGGREKVLGRLLKAWRDRKVAAMPKAALTGDIVPPAMLDRMVLFSAEVTQHGIEFINDGDLLEYMEQRRG